MITLHFHLLPQYKYKLFNILYFTFSNYDAHATELFEFLGWKDLARQREIHKTTMMFRCLHGQAPGYLNSKFTWRDSAYDLRTLKISSMSHYHALITTEEDLATMAPYYGTVFHAILGVPGGI